MNYTLTSFNTGQITLPKKRRSQFKTKHFLAEEQEGGLLIRPILDGEKDNLSYYEDKDGFGIYSDKGINPEDIISRIKSLNKK